MHEERESPSQNGRYRKIDDNTNKEVDYLYDVLFINLRRIHAHQPACFWFAAVQQAEGQD